MDTSTKSVVLVTGATGYVGSNVAHFLSNRGHKVVALARDKDKLEKIFGGSGIETLSADVTDLTSLGCIVAKKPKILIHAAGKVGIDGPKKSDEFFRVNTEGTRNVLSTLLRLDASVKFIHLSTVAVYCDKEGNSGKKVTEESMVARNTNIPYIDSKVAAEDTVMDIARSSKGQILETILRPGLIYGNERGHEKAVRFVPRILGLTKTPFGLPIIDNNPAPSNLIHLSNLLSAISLVLNSTDSVGSRYDLVDNQMYITDMNSYLSKLMTLYKIKNSGIGLSIGAARYLADMCESIQDKNSKEPLPMSRLLSIILYDSPSVDGRKLMGLKDDKGNVYSNENLVRSLESGLATLN